MNVNYGNYVTVDNPKHHPNLKNKIMVVCGFEKLRENESAIIKLNHINYMDNTVLPFASQFEKFIKPIPLTKEWLIKCGIAELTALGQTWPGRFINAPNTNVFNHELPEWIEFVHELQNWYYWKFNKTELTIK